MIKYSVIVPVYNEERVIGNCLQSLAGQTVAKEMEIIVVDDGSTDGTLKIIENCKLKIENFMVLRQNHGGPGAARNLGASKAKGEILIFVDADMEFAPDFIEKLTLPILASQEDLLRDRIVGTFSKEEYLLNKNFPIARYWNLNLGRPAEKMHPDNYPNTQAVFRAIRKDKFLSVNGFDTEVGYTDDWSLSKKLNTMAVVAPGAIYYHCNPETYQKVWQQARWFGKNEFLTRNLVRKFYNLFRYNPLTAITKIFDFEFFKFKIIYNTAVFTSVLLSFFNENKNK